MKRLGDPAVGVLAVPVGLLGALAAAWPLRPVERCLFKVGLLTPSASPQETPS